MRRIILLVLIISFCLFISQLGCIGSKYASQKSPSGAKVPKQYSWIFGIGNLELPSGSLYGVGSSPKAPAASVTYERGKERARADLAANFSAEIQSLTKDFEQTVQALTEQNSESSKVQELFQTTRQQFVVQTLVGAEMYDSWTDPVDGTYYVLFRLAKDNVAVEFLKSFQGVLNSEEIKEIKDEAEKAFNELNDKVNQWKK